MYYFKIVFLIDIFLFLTKCFCKKKSQKQIFKKCVKKKQKKLQVFGKSYCMKPLKNLQKRLKPLYGNYAK